MATGGHIHGLDKIWLKEDAAAYGDFVPVPCRRGGFGSRGRRSCMDPRTMVGPNEEPSFRGLLLLTRMEKRWTMKSRTSGSISRAHSTQEALNLTPSGLANRFGPIPYKFPPSTQLYLTSPISNALVCRTTWEDPVVQAQANVILGADRGRAMRMITKHRFDALRTFKTTYEMMTLAEKLRYGPDSFFSNTYQCVYDRNAFGEFKRIQKFFGGEVSQANHFGKVSRYSVHLNSARSPFQYLNNNLQIYIGCGTTLSRS